MQADAVVLQNTHIKVEINQFDDAWKLSKISRADGSDEIDIDSDEFEILLLDDRRFAVADYKAVSPPQKTNVNGRQVVRINYVPKSQTSSSAPEFVKITYELGDGPYFHKSIYLEVKEGTFVDRLQVMRFSTNDTASRGGLGQPVFVGNWFFGADYPGFYSRHSDGFVEPNFRYKHFYTIDMQGRDELELAPRTGLVTLFHFPGFPKAQTDSSWAITSKRAVAGLSETAGENAELGLYDYIASTRKPPRSNLHFNNWYSPEAKTVTVDNFVDNTYHSFAENLSPYGVRLDAMVPDHGWENTNSYNRVFEPKLDSTHDPLDDVSDALRGRGSSLGIWFTIDGTNAGYDRGIEIGYKPAVPADYEGWTDYWMTGTKKWFDILDARYISDLKKSLRFLLKDAKISYIKHDFNHNFSAGFITQRHARERCLDVTLDLHKYELSFNPDLFQNYTNGTWFSPWWLQYADSIWMMSGDSAGGGDWPQVSQKEGATTYRDSWLRQSWNDPARSVRPLIPIANLMTHGIIYSQSKPFSDFKDTLQDWSNYVVMYYARGTMVKEWYLTPGFLTDDGYEGEDDFWKALGKATNWAVKNQGRLINTLYVGGDPGQGEIYGYISWVDGRALLIVRNPDRASQTLEVPFDEKVYYRKGPGADYHARVVYPFVEQMPWKLTSGKNISVTVPGDSVIVYQIATGPPVAKEIIEAEPLPAFTSSFSSSGYEITLDVPDEIFLRCDLIVETWDPANTSLTIDGNSVDPVRGNTVNWSMYSYDLRKYRGKKLSISGELTALAGHPNTNSDMAVWLIADRAVSSEPVPNEDIPFAWSQHHRRLTQNLIARNNMQILQPGENREPYFITDSLARHDAAPGRSYVSVIAGSCIDPDMDSLTYSKLTGPDWLSVKSNGIVTGTPTQTDKGINKFTVRVEDGNGAADQATLKIIVIDTK
jgi:hypothetical protein